MCRLEELQQLRNEKEKSQQLQCREDSLSEAAVVEGTLAVADTAVLVPVVDADVSAVPLRVSGLKVDAGLLETETVSVVAATTSAFVPVVDTVSTTLAPAGTPTVAIQETDEDHSSITQIDQYYQEKECEVADLVQSNCSIPTDKMIQTIDINNNDNINSSCSIIQDNSINTSNIIEKEVINNINTTAVTHSMSPMNTTDNNIPTYITDITTTTATTTATTITTTTATTANQENLLIKTMINNNTIPNIHINNNNANNGNNKEFLMEGIVLSMQHELQLEEDLNHENETENEEEELHWGI